MIRIALYPAPVHFESAVRRPGAEFLRRTPHPRPSEWRKHNYWSKVHGDLVRLYAGICAYCASWMPQNTSNPQMRSSIDHFVARTRDPNQAYAWQNLRICRRRMNQNKGEATILDPAAIVNGWFQLDFDTFLISADRKLKERHQTKIDETIDQLDLNHTDYVRERSDVVLQYCTNDIDFVSLQARFPFIATEMQRVGFDRTRKVRMRAGVEQLRARGARIGADE